MYFRFIEIFHPMKTHENSTNKKKTLTSFYLQKELWNVFYGLKLVWFCFIVKNSFRKRFNLLSKILLFWDILTFWYKMLTFDHLSWIVMGMQRSEFNVFILIHNIFNPFFQFPNQEQNGATTILFIYLRQLTGI